MNQDIAKRIQHLHWQWGPEIMVLWLQDMYIWLGFSPKGTRLLVTEQGNNPKRLWVLIDKNNDDICNFVRKPGGKNANKMPHRGQWVSVISKKTHRWRCTFNGEIKLTKTEYIYSLNRKSSKMSSKTQTCCLRLIRLTWQEWWKPLQNISDHIMVL